jgi:Na+/H+ antiporter NhaD/arsenite permease-like protein
LPSTLVTVAAIAVFAATYLVMALGRAPGLRMDRAGAALAGAAAMYGLGILSGEEVFAAIDHHTIVLLLGMMIVTANLKLAGAFDLVGEALAARVARPLPLLTAVTVSTGVLSAFLVNDTVCLVMTPLVVTLVLKLGRDPVPYAIAVATASNVGSVATITGNPQNMIIGSLSKIPYVDFAAALAPVALIGLALVVVAVALSFRSEFFGTAAALPAPVADVPHFARAVRIHKPLVAKSLLVTAAMIAAFFAGLPVATAAIIGGGLLLVTRRVKPERIWREIDWPLLVMFCGLFVVTAALRKIALTPDVLAFVDRLPLGEPAALTLVSAGLSNIVSNVPAVLVLQPIVERLADPERAWLVTAMSSTLAGNLTLVGSVANLIVAERARAFGVEVGFWPYLKVGLPLTLATLALGLAFV